MSIATIEVQPRVKDIEITHLGLSVAMEDGRSVIIPLNWYPRLLHASDAERTNWRIFEDADERDIIFWEELDELIPVVALLTGTPSRESESSLNAWLATRRQSSAQV
ncbi:MAG: DUF2442 domain-containing protein [Caldilineaceae bacterium]